MVSGEEVAVAATTAVGKEILKGGSGSEAILSSLAADDSAMKRAATLHAENVLVRTALVNKLFSRIGGWFGVSREYFERDFDVDLAEKITFIPEDDVTEPKPVVAVPAIQGLGYSLDEPDLKDMYLELLASATDRRDPDLAHPSFAEIIKQLSPAEARELRGVLKFVRLPIVRVKVHRADKTSFNYVATHVLGPYPGAAAQRTSKRSHAEFVDNWIRLGLVEVDYGAYLKADRAYHWANTAPEVMDTRDQVQGADGQSVEFDRGILEPTKFGRNFARAVGIEPRS